MWPQSGHIAGRALEWHSRGQRFDPAYLHQKERHDRRSCLSFWIPLPLSLHPPVLQMLGASELPLRQGFRRRRKRLYGAKRRRPEGRFIPPMHSVPSQL